MCPRNAGGHTKNFPRVLLFGRTNIGKSALFNRMTGQSQTIVFGEPGVTRDYLEDAVSWNNFSFNLVDAGGLDIGSSQDVIGSEMQRVIKKQLGEADVVLFMCDVTTGVTLVDVELAKMLRKQNKPYILVLGKADNDNFENSSYEFLKLGLGEPIMVSALHGRGIGKLLNKITDTIPEQTEFGTQTPDYAMSIIGKPNVGKSSLLNAILEKERAIVSDVAGTTREAVSDLIHINDDLVKISDTAGIRRKRSVKEELETLMVKSSIQAIRDSDVVVLVVDASKLELCAQELKLLSFAMEQDKGVVLVCNKSDLVDEYSRKLMVQELKRRAHIIKKIPVVWSSCVTGKNVNRILDTVSKVRSRCITKLNEASITATVRESLAQRPLYRIQKRLKVFNVRPIRSEVPTFHLYVNDPILFGESDLSCIENLLRASYDLCGCPVRFSLIKI